MADPPRRQRLPAPRARGARARPRRPRPGPHPAGPTRPRSPSRQPAAAVMPPQPVAAAAAPAAAAVPPQQHYPPPQPQPGSSRPYGYGPPPGYGYGPPPGWQQPQWQQPYPAWAMAPREPDNSPAVAGFALSMVGGGLLFFFAGLSTILSLGLVDRGIVYSRKGREKVDRGRDEQAAGPGPGGLHHRDRLAPSSRARHGLLDRSSSCSLATDEEFQRELEDGNTGTIAIALFRGLLTRSSKVDCPWPIPTSSSTS